MGVHFSPTHGGSMGSLGGARAPASAPARLALPPAAGPSAPAAALAPPTPAPPPPPRISGNGRPSTSPLSPLLQAQQSALPQAAPLPRNARKNGNMRRVR